MSKRLPQVGGYYVQCEDELAGMHACAGASLGGLKAMTATSGPGYTLMHDAYGWSITNEIPLVVVDAMRVGPISGITGAPGQGEFRSEENTPELQSRGHLVCRLVPAKKKSIARSRSTICRCRRSQRET